MQLPDIVTYKDLHNDMTMPRITLDSVSSYLISHDKHLDKTCIDLYESGFVNYVRMSVVDQCTYLRAECRASMKVSVVYLVDICVDSNGVVKMCQCECGAGMGPSAHCKHVMTVLMETDKVVTTGI